MKKLTSLLMLLCLATGYAQAPDSLQTYNSRDSIIVVASRYQISLKNIAYSYQVIPGREVNLLAGHSALEAVDIQFPSAFMLDKKIVGYGVGVTGGGLLNMRGLGGKPNASVLVLLNGHPDFMGIFGHPLPDVYGMDDIEQVEVIAGASSTVYGNHAMGGVINLVSQPAYNRLARLSVEGGSFGAYRMGINLSKHFSRHGLFFTAVKKHSDGHLAKTEFESLHLQGGWNFQMNPVWSLSLQGRYVPYSFDDPDEINVKNTLNWDKCGKIERGTGELIIQNRSEKWQGSTQIYGNAGRHEFRDGFESNDLTVGFSAYQFWKASDQLQLAAGADLINYGGQAENKYSLLPNSKPVVNDDAHELTSFSLYLVGFYQPWPIVSFKSGMRYEHHSLPVFSISPMAAINLNLHPMLGLFANYQTAFRMPTLRELYLFPDANKDLAAEELRSYEAGVRFAPLSMLTGSVSIFKNDVDNLIQSLPNATPPPQYKNVNSGQADQWGVESQVSLRLNRMARLQLAYSHLDPDFLTAFNPQDQFKYYLTLEWRKLSAAIYGKYVHDLYANNNSADALPDYNLLNLAVSWQFPYVEAYARFLNVLDRVYYVIPNYRAPGFNVRLGLRFTL
jgi:iron complex outermembrane receptor protein